MSVSLLHFYKDISTYFLSLFMVERFYKGYPFKAQRAISFITRSTSSNGTCSIRDTYSGVITSILPD